MALLPSYSILETNYLPKKAQRKPTKITNRPSSTIDLRVYEKNTSNLQKQLFPPFFFIVKKPYLMVKQSK